MLLIAVVEHAARSARRRSTGTGSCAEPAGDAALVRRVAPSVVTIIVEEQRVNEADRAAQRAERRAQADADPNEVNAIIRRLLSAQSDVPRQDDGPTGSLGSGFVIREDGLIITNRHVIVGARTVKVRIPDGRELPARIVGSDAVTDIALLKIEAGRLPALRLGSSQAVAVGDAVIAIGNPYGLGQSVSAGIISARGRILEDDPYIDFLQTDAAINRGNSGGPLVTMDGTVVGVTSAIFSPSGGSVGLGFAIPAETVSAVARELEAHGRVARGYIGISAQTVTPELAAALRMKTKSARCIGHRGGCARTCRGHPHHWRRAAEGRPVDPDIQGFEQDYGAPRPGRARHPGHPAIGRTAIGCDENRHAARTGFRPGHDRRRRHVGAGPCGSASPTRRVRFAGRSRHAMSRRA